MLKNSIRSLLFISIFLCIQSPAFADGTSLFFNSVLGRASEKITTIIDTKSRDFNDQTKKQIQVKKESLIRTLHSIDTDIQTKDKSLLQRDVGIFRSAYKSLLNDLNTYRAPIKTDTTSENSEGTSSPVSILYYADAFEGGHASNGDTFSQAYFSAAKCVTPLNTLIQVTNGKKSVIVKNNDRPNCALHPDIVDLTKNAFSAIGKLSSGRLSGSFIALKGVPKSYYKKYIPSAIFAPLGITLEQGLPNTYLPNETIHISGREMLGKEDTLLYLQSPSGKDISLSRKKDASGHFEYAYPLSEIGTYHLVVTSGLGFETNTFADIVVLDPVIFSGKKLFPNDTPQSIASWSTEYIRFSEAESIYLLRFPLKKFYTVTLKQWEKMIQYSGMENVAIKSNALANFQKDTGVEVTITSSDTSTPFSHDTYTTPSTIFSKSMMLIEGFQTEKKENITLSLDGKNLSIHGTIPKWVNIQNEVVLTLPDGDVTKYIFDPAYVDRDGFLKRGIVFEKVITLEKPGQYLVELNYDNGFAAYNGPLVYGDNILPLLPTDYDRVDKKISGTPEAIRLRSLDFINTLRTKVGKSNIALDSTLTALATAKANDMANNNYVGHVDSKWEKLLGTAKRNGIKIASSLGENVAWGNVGADFLLIGLANSGGHRENMLGDWKKLGIGYVVKNGQVYFAQVFGE